jgi:hypothetical protein
LDQLYGAPGWIAMHKEGKRKTIKDALEENNFIIAKTHSIVIKVYQHLKYAIHLSCDGIRIAI